MIVVYSPKYTRRGYFVRELLPHQTSLLPAELQEREIPSAIRTVLVIVHNMLIPHILCDEIWPFFFATGENPG